MMRVPRIAFSALLILLSSGCKPGAAPKGNTNYPGNKPPLLQPKYVKLSLGAVRPEGWLKDQLIIQAKGLTGYVDEFYLIDSRWKGGKDNNPVTGTRDSWAVSYLNGLVATAYLLDDARLKQKAQEYIEWIISSDRPDGWFGPPWEEGYEEATVCDPGHQKRAVSALILYYEATKDPRVIPLAKNFMRFMMANIKEWPLNKWWGMGVMNIAPIAYMLYNETGDPAYLDYVRLVHEKSFDYETFYTNFPWDTKALLEHRVPWNWSSRGKTAHDPLIIGALVHPANWYLLSGDERSKAAVYDGLENLVKYHGQAGGADLRG
jgi:hypothetical protein